MNSIEINFILNGKKVSVNTNPLRTLLDVLRNDFKLTGTKSACEKGECGTCTVLVDDKTMNSCLIPIGQIQGKRILTIEGLSNNGKLHPIQKALIDAGGVQCGFCTPGFIISAYALLKHNSEPTEEEIKEYTAGNLCRCTGYDKIIKGIKLAAKRMKG